MKPRELGVVLGEHDLDREEGGEVRLAVAEIRIHPWYDHNTFDNDIGKFRMTTFMCRFRNWTLLAELCRKLPNSDVGY
jgi:hypothetical protein